MEFRIDALRRARQRHIFNGVLHVANDAGFHVLTMRDLRSPDASTRLAAFERAVLAVAGLDETAVDVSGLARAYVSLSDYLNDDDARTHRSSGNAIADLAVRVPSGLGATEVVFGLIYAARSFHVAHLVLAAHPPPPGDVLDLGAGWGSFGLAASLQDPQRRLVLVDVDERRLALAVRLFDTVGCTVPTARRADLRTFQPDRASAIVAGNVLNELDSGPGDVEETIRVVRRWLDALEPGGRIYIIEPGTREAARRVQTLRDALVSRARVLAPCCGAPACPRLAQPEEWCHVTRRVPFGEITRQIADHARRVSNTMHFSFLVIEKGEPRALDSLVRVLDVRFRGRPKLALHVCGPDGEEVLTILRRDRSLARRVESLEPGNLLHVELSGIPRRGDGLRIESEDQLQMFGSL